MSDPRNYVNYPEINESKQSVSDKIYVVFMSSLIINNKLRKPKIWSRIR